MSRIRRNDYLARPDVWGDERGELVSAPVWSEDVKPGDLYVFTNDHGNAYKVNSIDWVDMPEGPQLIRYNCAGGATAGAHERDVSHILLAPDQVAARAIDREMTFFDTTSRDADTWKRLVFYFHERVTDSGSMSYAVWHRDTQIAHLYSPEGILLKTKEWDDSTPTVDHVIDKVRASWGTVAGVKYSDRA